MIASVTNNWAIGKERHLLDPFPADMRRFKEITTGHTIVMGRTTWQSLPFRPLPNRRNVVLTSSEMETVETVHSIEDVLKMPEDVYIIGGGSVYKLFMPYADVLYITHLNYNDYDADTFFPAIDLNEWKVEEFEDNDWYAFAKYVRK